MAWRLRISQEIFVRMEPDNGIQASMQRVNMQRNRAEIQTETMIWDCRIIN